MIRWHIVVVVVVVAVVVAVVVRSFPGVPVSVCEDYISIIMGHLKIRLKISVRDSLDKVFPAFLHAGKGRDLPARRL